MGIDIPDWAISAEILTPSRAATPLPTLAAVGLAVALPHRIGCRPPLPNPT